MTTGQEANGYDSGKYFDLLHNNGILSVLIRIASINNEYTQHTISCKIRKFLENFVFLSYRKNFVGTKKNISNWPW